jgi:adenine-specific DNA-methyltransferase
MLEVGSDASDDTIVLDFFAGAGVTAQAVMEQNRVDGGKRKFILVQLPEPTGRSDYPTIVSITKERTRRAIEKLNGEDQGALDLNHASEQDRGFRVFKLAESNFKNWDAEISKDATALGVQRARRSSASAAASSSSASTAI